MMHCKHIILCTN